MSDFRTLQKNSRKECDGARVSVCVMGDVATQFLAQAVKGYGYECNLNLNVVDIDYNQIDMQTMDSTSELYTSKSDYILIYMSAEKLYEKFCQTAISLRDKFAEIQIEYIKEVHNRINSNINSKILQFNFIEINDNVFGSYGSKVPVSFIFQIKKLNYLLNEYSSAAKNVFIIDLSSLAVKYGYDFILNEKYFYSAKMALSIEILPYAAKAVVDVIKAISGSIKKCVILDLDNTLWGGVIGDDGLGGSL